MNLDDHKPQNLALQYREYADAERSRWAALDAAGVQSWADVWENAVLIHANRNIAQEVNSQRAFTYAELDQYADRIAAWAIARDEACYGVRLQNGIAFLAIVIGLAKAGRLSVLLNTRVPQETSKALALSCGVRTIIGEALPGLAHVDLNDLLTVAWPGRSPRAARAPVTLDNPAVVIFTSGTTGNSKPALFSHRRLIGAGIAWGLRTGLTANDRCYITLPLYHGNALAVAFSSVVDVGATAILRDRFSVRSFIDDVRRYNCTAVVYIGELWRYLSSAPISSDESEIPLRIAFGNGLNQALWGKTVRRFGIQRVVEHYGATEMPAGALTNWTGCAGYCGFIPPDHPDSNDVLLVDEAGQPVPNGTPGELLLRVRSKRYRGYLDPTLDEARLRRGVCESDDLWWRSGDLLTRTDDGFFTFVDRMGDTFRWRGENVASADVEDAIYTAGLVEEAVVFGVRIPGEEGKVGMASVVARKDSTLLNIEQIRLHLERTMPPYAIPIFVRQVPEAHSTTATLKIQKRILADDPFALLGTHPHWVLRDGGYVPLDRSLLDTVMSDQQRLRPGIGLSDSLQPSTARVSPSLVSENPRKVGVARPTSLLGTRIHAQHGVMPDISDLRAWCEAALRLADEVAIATDMQTHADVQRKIAGLGRVYAVLVNPWGRFTTALNALVREAACREFEHLILMSFEIDAESAPLAVLRQWASTDVLVVGARLAVDHGSVPGQQELHAQNSPWNTLALWSTRLLTVFGFPSVADGYGQSEAAGMEEVVTISLLQHFYGEEARAYLVDAPGIVWRQVCSDPIRDAAHRKKMETKLQRATAQMERLRVPRGSITVVSSV
jgi:fatty-acyl-CoA synthase